MEDGQRWRYRRQIAVGIGVAPWWDGAGRERVQTTLVRNESQSAWVAEACAAGRKPIHWT